MRYLVVIFACILGATPTLHGAAVCPSKNAFVAWEPFYWHRAFNGKSANIVNNMIVEKIVVDENNPPEHQGYRILRYRGGIQDVNGNILFESGIGECTRFAFDTLANEAGVLLIDTHGNIGSVIGVTGPRFFNQIGGLPIAPDEIDQWRNNDANMSIKQRTEDNDDCWIITVKNNWFSANYKETLNSNQAIVCVSACHSAEPLKDNNGNFVELKDEDGNIIPMTGNDGLNVDESVVDACGGRFRLGYIGSPMTDEAENDIRVIFGRMSGVLPVNPDSALGTLRLSTPADVATSEGKKVYTDLMRKDMGLRRMLSGFTPTGPKKPVKFVMQQSSDGKPTTLCPAVAVTPTMRIDFSSEPKSATAKVFPAPATQNAARVANGFVEFDTECDTNVPASEVLVADQGCSVVLNNVRWVGNSRIEFGYTATCEGATIKLVVKAMKLRGKGSVLHLDGNNDPSTPLYDDNGNLSAPASGGVAPSKDDFSWIFKTS